MNILVVNAGSSSVKFTCFNMDHKSVLANGLVERIGLKEPRLTYGNIRGQNIDQITDVSNARQAVGLVATLLRDPDLGVIQQYGPIAALGHRVVHGGEQLTRSVVADRQVKKVIKDCFELAPLHNPPNLEGIEAGESYFPGAPQVAVFDTAFHSTIPQHAYLYGLPYAMYAKDKIRRYGFHGISHKYVSRQAADFLGHPVETLKLITCHLGNGCSITAVDGGQSVDTSMGMTPLEGLIMGTRCGDLDPAVVFHLLDQKAMSPSQVYDLLNKQSGLLGLAGIGSPDVRDILSARKAGNQQAHLALQAFAYRIKKYIGAYIAAMGGVDALVFTAGIGENSPEVREAVCGGLDNRQGFSIALDLELNKSTDRQSRKINSEDSGVTVLVIPTNEEKEIAEQTALIIRNTNTR